MRAWNVHYHHHRAMFDVFAQTFFQFIFRGKYVPGELECDRTVSTHTGYSNASFFTIHRVGVCTSDTLEQEWHEAKEGNADVMVPGGDEDDVAENDSREDEDGDGVGGDELFNRCINTALEAQEVRRQIGLARNSAKRSHGIKHTKEFMAKNVRNLKRRSVHI